MEEIKPRRRCMPSLLNIVSIILSLIIGLTVGLTGMPIAVGVFITLGLATYFIVGNSSARLLVVFAVLGAHAGYLARLHGSRIVLPFIVVEKGIAGSSIYPDPAQLLLAYEAYRRYTSCRQNNYKPKSEVASPEAREEGAAVV